MQITKNKNKSVKEAGLLGCKRKAVLVSGHDMNQDAGIATRRSTYQDFGKRQKAKGNYYTF